MLKLKEQLTTGGLKYAESIAPAGGGGFGLLAFLAEWSPLLSAVSILVGLLLGILTYIWKRDIYRLEKQKLKAEIEGLKNRK